MNNMKLCIKIKYFQYQEVPSKKIKGSTVQNQKKLMEKSGGAVLNAVKEQLLKVNLYTNFHF